ncbi:hypothetical protein [Globicatella sanguinis]
MAYTHLTMKELIWIENYYDSCLLYSKKGPKIERIAAEKGTTCSQLSAIIFR